MGGSFEDTYMCYVRSYSAPKCDQTDLRMLVYQKWDSPLSMQDLYRVNGKIYWTFVGRMPQVII